MLKRSCDRFPDKAALRHKVAGDWEEMNYRQLWQHSERVAVGLIKAGFKPGDRAAILATASPPWIAVYLAILKSGGIVVPIDKELKSGELRHILSDCEARVLFTEVGFLDALLEITDDLPQLEKIVLLHDNDGALNPRIEVAIDVLISEWHRLMGKYGLPREEARHLELLADNVHQLLRPVPGGEGTSGASSLFAEEEAQRRRLLRKKGLEPLTQFACDGEAPATPRQPGDTAVILYTSGTTGRSKGAMLSHANILSNIHAATELYRLDSSMQTLSFLPINHVFEQVAGILLPLSVGGTVTFAESIKKLGQNLAEVRPNFLLGVPAVFRLLYERILKNVKDRPLARTLFSIPLTRRLVTGKVRKSLGDGTIFVSGGAALDPEIARGLDAIGIAIYQGYGITETSPVIAAEHPEGRRFGSVGKPLPEQEVRIEVPNDEGVGEIVVKGPNVMQGYYNNPQATAEVLVDGWYHTGDLGRLDADGYLYICGRARNLIVTPNGKNVYPEEVENELMKSPFIAEVMVYGHKVSPTAEEVHAIIYPDQEALDAYFSEKGIAPLRVADVERQLRQEVLDAGKRLADYKRVKKFTLREDEFPKTTTRKIKRFAVEAQITATE
jgi:long-chain acyl-CoA synthetase